MSSNLTEKLKLKKLVKQLKDYRGRHTELISVYLPSGNDITKLINTLQDEQGTASNIKDKNTSKAVITALERMIRTLKTIPQTPKNGLVIFSGNVSEKDNVDNCQVFWLEPPEPVPLKLYRCEQRFVTAPLEEMGSHETVYALVAIDKSEATVGLLVGSTIKVLKSMHSSVPGKFKTGGQSAQRFERIRENEAVNFYNRVAEVMIAEFTYMNELKGIIIGGPGTTKNNFATGNHLNDQIKKKILAIKDITYTNEDGLKDLLEKSADVLAEDEVMAEKKIIGEFLTRLGKDQTFVSYGMANTKIALEMGAVDRLIIIDDCIDEKTLEEFSDLCDKNRSELILVTDKTAEGAQLKGLTGIGAILRYPIHN